MKKDSKTPKSTDTSGLFRANISGGDGPSRIVLETMGFKTPAEGMRALAKQLSSEEDYMPKVIENCKPHGNVISVLLVIKKAADEFLAKPITPDTKTKTAEAFMAYADELNKKMAENAALEGILSTTLHYLRRFDKFARIRETSADVSPQL